ncbi:MAG TPA: carbohydrate porin, partial [Methylocella sp.]|nr:carbohydrate porin [Methylocella sp.]
QGKLYLAAGGLGGIIGDGQLPNAGPEQILEAFYRVGVFEWAHFGFDYQFINHPAYNRDRGAGIDLDLTGSSAVLTRLIN